MTGYGDVDGGWSVDVLVVLGNCGPIDVQWESQAKAEQGIVRVH